MPWHTCELLGLEADFGVDAGNYVRYFATTMAGIIAGRNPQSADRHPRPRSEMVGLSAHFAPGTTAECQTERGDEFPGRQGCAIKGLSS